MKKVFFIGAMMLCGMMLITTNVEAQTRKQKKEAQKAEWEHQQKMKELQRQRELDSVANLSKPADEVFMELPCYEESLSKGEGDPYFRELGIGEDLDRMKARPMAVDNANNIIKRRLGGVVKGLATDYSKTVSTKTSPAKMEEILEREFITVVDKVVNDADKGCEKISQKRSGEWVSYYVVWVKKADLTEKLAEAAAQNEELKVEIDRDKFRKYAEEYLKKNAEK